MKGRRKAEESYIFYPNLKLSSIKKKKSLNSIVKEKFARMEREKSPGIGEVEISIWKEKGYLIAGIMINLWGCAHLPKPFATIQ